MYYLNPQYFSEVVGNYNLPLFQEELREAFTIIPSRYKTRTRDFSQDLRFKVSFLVSHYYKPKVRSFEIDCIKVVYDIDEDRLKISSGLNNSELFDTYQKSSFGKDILDETSKGILITNRIVQSQRIILLKSDLVDARNVISNGLKNNGFCSLDDLILNTHDSIKPMIEIKENKKTKALTAIPK